MSQAAFLGQVDSHEFCVRCNTLLFILFFFLPACLSDWSILLAVAENVHFGKQMRL